VVADISTYVNSGEIDEALQLLADFLETIPYCDNTHYEGHWQQTLYIMFALLTNYDILVEQHTAKGRIDITMALGRLLISYTLLKGSTIWK
jgi:hypothetical protein